MTKEVKDFINKAVISAITLHDPEAAMKILYPLILEGYRSKITDSIILLLKKMIDTDDKHNALDIMYYLHGTEGISFDPKLKNPRPENAKLSEPMHSRQLEQLIRLALDESDEELVENYASLFDSLPNNVELSIDELENLRKFLRRCMGKGSDYSKSRSESLLKRKGWL